ncbi:hypothetical protein [Leptospira adleri]|uniref:Glycosyltransferase RgtA/B/C/D-like domain-containing protein n=1 Tax=Leptospira adleri TaxID=2023186 RepID=A0A2M9YIR3_9LEPT|nr:hypothetical protein [Leptospira adleri]PJZ51439.1 hypothetical protein CH380_19980 [Leptospira adleri]PJZ61680.1 hypothetical protein CH376_11860 [Leptospira adleri]
MFRKFKKEIVLVAISFFVFLTSLNNQPQISDLVFNADILYPAVLYQDIITDGNSFLGWSVTPSPYFFPDIAAFFLIKLFVDDGVKSQYVVFFLQALALLGALLFFIRSGIDSDETKDISSKISIWVYSIFIISFSFQSYFFPVLGFAVHGGALVFTLISGAMWLSEKRKKNSTYFWILFGAMQIFLIVSDPLYFFYSSLPCLFFAGKTWIRKREKEDRNSFLLLLFFIGIGLILYKNLTKSDLIFIPTNYYQRETSWNFIRPLWLLIQNQILFTPYSFLLLILFYLSSWMLLRLSNERTKKKQPFDEHISFSALVVLVSSFGILISGAFSGIFQKDGIAIRYLLPLLFFWIPFLIVALLRLSTSYLREVFRGLSLIILIVGACSSYWGDLRPRLYRDSLADCLDRKQEIVSRSRGLSDFWNSRRIRIFSQKDLRADNYLQDLHPEYWQNSWNWFIKVPEREYNFAVLPGLDEKRLKEEFGEPNDRVFCEKHEILIWDSDSKERFVRFRKKKIEEIELWRRLTGRKS